MDIAICLDCTSSIGPTFCEVRDRISAIVEPILRYNHDIRLALIEFRSRVDSRVTVIHPFTHSTDAFQYWLNQLQAYGGSQDGTRAISKTNIIDRTSLLTVTVIGDALREVLRLDWRSTVGRSMNT